MQCATIVLCALLTAPVGAQDDPPALKLTMGPGGVRHEAYQRTVAIVGAEADEGKWWGLGVFIAPDEIVVPFAAVERSERVTVQPLCCDEFEAEAVIGGDLASGILILRVDVGALPAPFRIVPAPLAGAEDLPAPGAAAVWTCTAPLPVGEDDDGKMLGFMSAELSEEEAEWRDYAGEARRLRAPWGSDVIACGGPLFDAGNRLVGFNIEDDGDYATLFAPADQVASAPRFDPAPLPEFAARELTEPERIARLRHVGGSLRFRKQFEQAVAPLRQVVELAPGDWRAWFELGVSLDMSGQSHEALRALMRSHEIEPECAETLYSLGVTLHRMDEPVAATHFYHKALQLEPRHAKVHGNLAAAAEAAGRIDLMAEHSRISAELDPIEQRTRQAEVAAAALTGARDTLAELEASGPRTSEQWFTLAKERRAVGNIDGAFAALTEAEQRAETADDLLPPQVMRVLWVSERGDYARASALIGALAARAQDDPRLSELAAYLRRHIELSQGRLESLLEEAPPR